MRKFGALILVIFCLVILVISYSTWKEKIGTAAEKPQETSKAAETKHDEKGLDALLTRAELEVLSAGMDVKAQGVLFDKFDNNEKVQLLLVGSGAMNAGDPGYAQLVKEELDRTYNGFIETTAVSFNGTSENFINEETDLSVGYDVVIMEPFTLLNNGVVQVESEQEHILEFIGRVRAAESGAALILQPPQPIYGAQFYTFQVKSLEKFAGVQGFGYINHWPAWPETTDETLKDFLTADGLPNTEGAALWADELTEYLISE